MIGCSSRSSTSRVWPSTALRGGARAVSMPPTGRSGPWPAPGTSRRTRPGEVVSSSVAFANWKSSSSASTSAVTAPTRSRIPAVGVRELHRSISPPDRRRFASANRAAFHSLYRSCAAGHPLLGQRHVRARVGAPGQGETAARPRRRSPSAPAASMVIAARLGHLLPNRFADQPVQDTCSNGGCHPSRTARASSSGDPEERMS